MRASGEINEGWGEESVLRELAMSAWGPECESSTSTEKGDAAVFVCSPSFKGWDRRSPGV